MSFRFTKILSMLFVGRVKVAQTSGYWGIAGMIENGSEGVPAGHFRSSDLAG